MRGNVSGLRTIQKCPTAPAKKKCCLTVARKSHKRSTMGKKKDLVEIRYFHPTGRDRISGGFPNLKKGNSKEKSRKGNCKK